MATEKINEIFDIEAINRQVQDVKKGIGDVLNDMESFAKKMSAINAEISKTDSFRKLSEYTDLLVEAQEEHKKKLNELDTLKKQEISLNSKLNQAYLEQFEKIERIRQSVSEQTKSIRDKVKAEKENAAAQELSKKSTTELINEYKKHGNSIRELNAENKKLRELVRNLDYKTQGDQIKQLNAIIDENTAIIKANSDTNIQNKINIGGYTESIKEAIGQTGIFNEVSSKLSFLTKSVSSGFKGLRGQISGIVDEYKKGAESAQSLSGSQKAAAVTSNILAGGLRILKVALVSTGIGALIVALGSLVAYLTKTQEGSEKLSRIMAKIGAVVDVVIDRVAKLGGSLVKLFSGDFKGAWKDTKDAFTGIGDEMSREIKLAGELKDAMIDIEKREVMLTMKVAANRAEVKKLKLASDDTTKSIKERIASAQKATEIEQDQLKEQIVLQKQRLANMLGLTSITKEAERLMDKLASGAITADEMIKNLGLSESTIVDLREFAEEYQKLKGAEEQSYERRTELQNKTNQLITDQVNRTREATKTLTNLLLQETVDAQKEIVDNDRATYEDRVKALEIYYDKQAEIIRNGLEYDLTNSKKNEAEKKLLIEQARIAQQNLEKKRQTDLTKLETDETKKRSESIIKTLQKQQSLRENQIKIDQEKELIALSKKYSAGNITTEEYEKERLNITKKYEKEIFDAQMASLVEIANNLPEEERAKAFQEIELKRLEFEKKIADEEVRVNKEKNDKIKEQEKALKDAREKLAREAFSTIVSLINSSFERRVQSIDIEIEKIEEQKNADIEAVTQMGLSNEEMEARKMAIEARAAKQTDKLEKQKKKAQKQQAITQKSAALMEVAIDTAKGVAKAVAESPLTFGMPWSAFVAATGALQAAVIAAQPIPKYAKGTEDHPGGLAIVGDAGKEEVAIFPDGKYYVTPKVPTIVDLPKGTEVLPDANDVMLSIAKAQRLDPNVPNPTARIEKRIESLEGTMKSVITAIEKNRSQFSVILDQNGVWKAYDKQKGMDTYLSKTLHIER